MTKNEIWLKMILYYPKHFNAQSFVKYAIELQVDVSFSLTTTGTYETCQFMTFVIYG